MRPAGTQRPADADDEHRAVRLCKSIFPFLWCERGPLVLQLLRGGKRRFPAQPHALQRGELPFQLIQRAAHRIHDLLHSLLQIFGGSLLPGDDLFPVPLVHINGVKVVHLLVPADGVHVCDQTVAHMEIILSQSHALPLRQRMHHLGVCPQRGHVEGDGALHAVQIIVQARGRVHEQRRRHALQMQRAAQLFQEDLLDKADGLLCVIKPQRRPVPGGNDGFRHDRTLPRAQNHTVRSVFNVL